MMPGSGQQLTAAGTDPEVRPATGLRAMVVEDEIALAGRP